VELTSSDWVYAKTKELLFYLLLHPSSTKEQIGLALWRDASPARLRSNLGVALHYLRRALGRPDWIVISGDHYSFNRSLIHWVDVEEFESNLARARQLPRAAAQTVESIDQTIELYRGDLLQDIDAEWCVPWREELRRKFLETLVTSSQALIAAGQYRKAAEMLRRALAQDDLSEVAHRELIRCYARMGEHGQALRHYQELVELMQRELDAAPDRETVALYERLRRGEEI
jgi:two-component SAPR family response regulator